MSLTAVKNKKQNNSNPVLSQDLTFKAEELQQFDKILDQIPFGYAKVIVQFFQLVRQKRTVEAQAAAQKADIKTAVKS